MTEINTKQLRELVAKYPAAITYTLPADEFRSLLDALEQAARAEQVEWQPASTAPIGERLILCWDDSQSLPPHWEVGCRKTDGWTNTYGRPFSGEPTHWTRAPSFPHWRDAARAARAEAGARIAELEAKFEAAEATFEDEEAAHEDTLRLLAFRTAERDALRARLDVATGALREIIHNDDGVCEQIALRALVEIDAGKPKE